MGSRERGEGRTADGKTRIDYCRHSGGGGHRSIGSCGCPCLSKTMTVAAYPPLVSRAIPRGARRRFATTARKQTTNSL